MITRTFRADSMIQALEQIKKDLGQEALVVSARQIPGGQPWQVWRKPVYEVIAVRLEPGEENSDVIEMDHTEQKTAPSRPVIKDLNRKDISGMKKSVPSENSRSSRSVVEPVTSPHVEKQDVPLETMQPEPMKVNAAANPVDVVDIRSKTTDKREKPDAKVDLIQQLGKDETLEEVRIIQVPSRKKTPLPPLQLPRLAWEPRKDETGMVDGAWPVLQRLHEQLLRQGLDPAMAKRICQLTADTLGYETAMDARKVADHIRNQLEAHIKVIREASIKTGQVICMIGPSGAGKTSFSAKLAVRYRNELKRSVAWVCADTVRIGGIAEARAFTEAINIPMKVAYTPAECSAIVESLVGTDLIIVDTPACNPRREESLVETGSLLTALPGRSTWVVVPATAKENDLSNTIGAFSVFKPRGLVVTKMDETNSFGPVYNIGVRSQLPYAYFSCGSRILDDLVPAAGSRLVQSLFTERFDR